MCIRRTFVASSVLVVACERQAPEVVAPRESKDDLSAGQPAVGVHEVEPPPPGLAARSVPAQTYSEELQKPCRIGGDYDVAIATKVVERLRLIREAPPVGQEAGLLLVPQERSHLPLEAIWVDSNILKSHDILVNPRPYGEVLVAFRDGVKTFCVDTTGPIPMFVLRAHIL